MIKPESKQNLELLSEFMKEGRNVAAFVGAGASAPLGIKTWDELLVEMAKEFNTGMEVKNAIKNGKKNHAEIASEIYDHINNHNSYLKFLQDQFDPTNASYVRLHNLLVNCFSVILTTNFDPAFEIVFKDKRLEYTTQKFPNFSLTNLFHQRTIVYLHGNNEENKYILRKEEYEAYYPSVSDNPSNGSPELENFLRAIFREVTLLFIGFSFEDTYFYNFFRKVVKEEGSRVKKLYQSLYQTPHPGENIQHFVIFPYDEIGTKDKNHRERQEKKIERIKNIGLRPIYFNSGKYTEIENIILRLSRMTGLS